MRTIDSGWSHVALSLTLMLASLAQHGHALATPFVSAFTRAYGDKPGAISATDVGGRKVSASNESEHYFVDGVTNERHILALSHNTVTGSANFGVLQVGGAGGLVKGEKPPNLRLDYPNQWNLGAATIGQTYSGWSDIWTLSGPATAGAVTVRVNGVFNIDIDYLLVNTDRLPPIEYGFWLGGQAVGVGSREWNTDQLIAATGLFTDFHREAEWSVDLHLSPGNQYEIRSSISASAGYDRVGCCWQGESFTAMVATGFSSHITNIEILAPEHELSMLSDIGGLAYNDSGWYLTSASGTMVATPDGFNYQAAIDHMAMVPEPPSWMMIILGGVLLAVRSRNLVRITTA